MDPQVKIHENKPPMVFLLSLLTLLSPAEKYGDNLSFLEELTNKLLRKWVLEQNLPRDQLILLKRISPQSIEDWFLENRFLCVLKEQNYHRVRLGSQSPEGIVIEFKIIKLGIDYPRIIRSGLWGNREVERRGEVKVALKLYRAGQGEVMWAGVIGGSEGDRVPLNMVKNLENKGFSFTQAPLPCGGGFSRILEPAVVLGVTGVVIYLFFSIRSK